MNLKKTLILASCVAGSALASAGALAQTTGSTMPNDPTSMPEPKMLQMDKDGDGMISKKEADANMRRNWDKWDVNKDGMIDTAEYSAAGIGGGKPAKN